MKVYYEETIRVEIDLPDYYAFDESLEGKMATIILGGDKIRSKLYDNLYSEDKFAVLEAARQFKDAYGKVHLIVETLPLNAVG